MSRFASAIASRSKEAIRLARRSTKASNRVRETSIDPAIAFRGLRVEIVAPDNDLKRTASARELRQSLVCSPTGQDASGDLGLAKDGLLAARESHVESQREFATAPSRPSADRTNADDGRLRQTQDDIDPRGKARRARLHGRFGCARQIVASEVKFRIRAVKDDHPKVLLRFNEFHQMLEFQDGLWINQVHGRIAERDAPIGGGDRCDYKLLEES